jgi:hypothetical protein
MLPLIRFSSSSDGPCADALTARGGEYVRSVTSDAQGQARSVAGPTNRATAKTRTGIPRFGRTLISSGAPRFDPRDDYIKVSLGVPVAKAVP